MNVNEIEYKGYIGSVEYSDEDGAFHGKVLYTDGCLLSYEGNNIDGLKKDFHGCIDDYLDSYKRKNKELLKSCKGSFNVRTSPSLHMSAVNRDKEMAYH